MHSSPEARAARAYDAVLIDVDGTLVDDAGHVHARTRAALHAAHAAGAVVMIATGRSESGVEPVARELGLPTPVLVYNGAGLWDPVADKMLEERVLANRAVARALEFAQRSGYLPVVMRSGDKTALHPRDEIERSALERLTALRFADWDALPREYAIRITLFSARHADSLRFHDEVLAALDLPLYLTHFPLAHLVDHRASPLQVVDIQPPCRGKAEGLRVLRELFGIAPERVVAIGDATNDIPMFEAAGLAVAMAESMPAARAKAARVIGSCNSDALGALIEELFLDGFEPRG